MDESANTQQIMQECRQLRVWSRKIPWTQHLVLQMRGRKDAGER
jgi:hypothetical protein